MASLGPGAREVVVAAARLEGWLARFELRHGPLSWEAAADEVVVRAGDGSVARCRVLFGPLVVTSAAAYGGLVAHVTRPWRVGVLLVRLGGHAAGVFEGDRLVTSKVGSRQVHGRSAAGGQSQKRFARRREGQVRMALAAAAEVAVRVLVPVAGSLDALVLGGDRRSVEAVLADDRLTSLRPLVVEPLLDVPDPRRKVLEQTPERFRVVRVRVVDPPGLPSPPAAT